MTDALLLSLVQIVQICINTYMWIIIIQALISWVSADPYNPIVQILYKLTAPAYTLIRRIPTRIGSVDLAPLVLVLGLQFLNILVANLAVKLL
ncbi:YggT family protein [Campylobacter sp.]|uniref:YggT family protein n=1 Tax=Campylobacter sp. TaxID=205 RepID=UPI0026DAC959|nr:YggT family protein [Campylobacter sp.]MDO4673944.1 YggT family protein [Campylobacter sp.]